MTTHDDLTFVTVRRDDPLAAPLLAELAVEYATRYDGTVEGVAAWLRGQPAADFAPPDGGMVVGLLDGDPVTGGAFCRFDDRTAELKRIWTHSGHRRKGYGAATLAVLQADIVARGYRRIYLTTGPKQPEAEALYLATGYRKLAVPLDHVHPGSNPVAFLKDL